MKWLCNLLIALAMLAAPLREAALAEAAVPAVQTATDAAMFQHARQQVDAILARREFQMVAPPQPWWRQLAAKLWFRVDRWLSYALGHSRGTAGAGLWLPWALIAGCVAGITIWMWRMLRREGLATRFVAPGTGQACGDMYGTDWSADVIAWAAREQWREAIHAQYWACIVGAERLGFWQLDPAQTPREYLRRLAAGERREALRSLTHLLETAWYGHEPAQEQDWQIALSLSQILLRTEARRERMP